MDSPYILAFSFVVLLCAYCLELAKNYHAQKTIKHLERRLSEVTMELWYSQQSDED